MENRREVFLTFDVEGPPFSEDFMNDVTVDSLLSVLRLLNKFNLKGIFFILGSVVEKISESPEALEMLENHEIGYHSSVHSVKPRSFEYADVEDYSEAKRIALKRETSSIDPLTGEIDGKGGLLLLRKIFPNHNITCFRSPFLCWSPPHLEAMRDLGLKFDFSTNIWQTPISHKKITFYPSPIQVDSRITSLGLVNVAFTNSRLTANFLPRWILKRNYTILMAHPATLAYKALCNTYLVNNQSKCSGPLSKLRNKVSSTCCLGSLEFLFWKLKRLQQMDLIKVTPPLMEAIARLDSTKINLNNIYNENIWAPKQLFGYSPKFLFSHFQNFFIS